MAKDIVSVGPYPDRPIRIGVASRAEEALVAEKTSDAGADVVLGADESAGIVVRGWRGPSTLLISKGTHLHLAPGMRLIMCDEAGGHRVTGTFEELEAKGMTFPMLIPVSRLTLQRAQDGMSVFVQFVGQES